jgi:glycosidase
MLIGVATVHADALQLDVASGDAWTLQKSIAGTFAPQTCDRIDVQTEGASVRAQLHNERFYARVPLKPGVNQVTVICKQGDLERERATQEWREQLPDAPKAWIRTRIEHGIVHLDGTQTQAAHSAPAPVKRYEWWAGSANPAPLVLQELMSAIQELKQCDAKGRCALELAARISIALPKKDGEYYIKLRAIDAFDRSDEATAAFRVDNGRALRVDVDVHRPSWVNAAIVYGIAPSLYPSPAFRSITARMDEIARLGATVLWLAPVTEAPNSDFGYAVSDPFRVRARYGSEADLHALIDAAHRRGLHVIVDFVANHFSDQHPYYIDAERRGVRSPYYEWFLRDAAGKAEHYFDWHNLKNLNYDHPEVQNYMLAAFSHWLRSFDVDGFRVDASWGVMARAPEFWARWRQEMKRINPDVFLLAEASARDDTQLAHSFDAAYDWTENLGEWAWKRAFGEGGRHPDVAALRAALEQSIAHERHQPVFRFLNNNDTGARFITRYGLEQNKIAAALLFTIPGVPLIYNGEEVGAEFDPYATARPIAWRDKFGLRSYYSRLAQLRRAYPVLHSRDLQFLETGDQNVLAYERVGTSSLASVVVVLNFADRARRVSLQAGLSKACAFADLLTGERSAAQAGALSLAPHAALILQPQACAN